MNNDGTSTSPTDALAVVQENTPVRVSSAPSKELVVRDGQVILPETRCVAPADKEFEELVLTHAIPRDELPELLDALHGKRSAYSPVMKLLFLVGFAVIGVLVYFFRPRPPELIDSSSVLVIDTQTPSKVSKEFSALLKQANFLEEEETKLIDSYEATRLDGGVVKVMGDTEKNAEFIQKMRDVQSMEIDVETVPIREDELLRYAQIRPDDIGKIKGLLKGVEESGTV